MLTRTQLRPAPAQDSQSQRNTNVDTQDDSIVKAKDGFSRSVMEFLPSQRPGEMGSDGVDLSLTAEVLNSKNTSVYYCLKPVGH